MNEPIEKLFDQALEEFKAENKYATVIAPDPVQRDFVEKFARLIVRECIDIASQEDFDVMMKEGYPCSQTAKKIQQHFGVEE